MKKRIATVTAALSCLVCAEMVEAQGVAEKWEATYALDIWGDPTGIDLISHGHWHERGSAESNDPLFVVRCRKGKPVTAHVDWRQPVALGDSPLHYEVRGGPRITAAARGSDRGFVLEIGDAEALLARIEGHSHVALFGENRNGASLSARFYVEDISPAVRERCDSSAQADWVNETELPAAAPIWVAREVTDEGIPPKAIVRVLPEYTDQAKKARIQGVVILKLVISETGEVAVDEVMKGLSHGLTKQAVAAVRQWTFEPARRHGIPVASYWIETLSFQLW